VTAWARARRWIAGLVLGAGALAPAWAHKGSDAYLALAPEGARIAVALKDLDQAVALDANADGRVTWGEVRAAETAVHGLLARDLRWLDERGAACHADWRFAGLERRSDGTYWVAEATWPCAGADAVRRLDYRLFATTDTSHRLLLSGERAGQPVLATLAPGESHAFAAAAQAQGRLDTVVDHVWLGAAHLLQGPDHIAFLLALVLPLHLALRLPGRAWNAGRPPEWRGLLAAVTAFTVGHSITLGLATLGWLRVGGPWVETMIVVSIGVTALLNLYPVRRLPNAALALVFGLVHGLGFVGLLREAGASPALLPWALLGFNLGIELAQLALVAAWVLIVQPAVHRPWYEARVVRGGSWALLGASVALLAWRAASAA